jgi:hypothetical protein
LGVFLCRWVASEVYCIFRYLDRNRIFIATDCLSVAIMPRSYLYYYVIIILSKKKKCSLWKLYMLQFWNCRYIILHIRIIVYEIIRCMFGGGVATKFRSVNRNSFHFQWIFILLSINRRGSERNSKR